MNCNSENGYYIYLAYITTRDGHRIYASSYGKRAFRIFVKDSIR